MKAAGDFVRRELDSAWLLDSHMSTEAVHSEREEYQEISPTPSYNRKTGKCTWQEVGANSRVGYLRYVLIDWVREKGRRHDTLTLSVYTTGEK